jgi:hypothetical protein
VLAARSLAWSSPLVVYGGQGYQEKLTTQYRHFGKQHIKAEIEAGNERQKQVRKSCDRRMKQLLQQQARTATT